jgi:hypothetical protein
MGDIMGVGECPTENRRASRLGDDALTPMWVKTGPVPKGAVPVNMRTVEPKV